MPKAARKGDLLLPLSKITGGSRDVFINNKAAARKGDGTSGHHGFPPSSLKEGSSSVYINNKPACRVGDTINVHCLGQSCHIEPVILGSGDVYIDG